MRSTSLLLGCVIASGCSSPKDASPSPPPPALVATTTPATDARPAAPTSTVEPAASSAPVADRPPTDADFEDDGLLEDVADLRVGPPPKRRLPPAFETGRCSVPHGLSLLPKAEWSAALEDDPLVSGVVAFKGPTEGALPSGFRLEHVNAGGPGDEIRISRDGRFVLVEGSRGGVAIQRKNGSVILHTYASSVALAPAVTYALVLPTKSFKGTSRLLVKVPLAYREAPTTVLDVGPRVDAPDVAVDICGTGRTYAVTSGARGLSILDAVNDDVVASDAKAPAGAPTFSASGRLVALRADGELTALYKLVRAKKSRASEGTRVRRKDGAAATGDRPSASRARR